MSEPKIFIIDKRELHVFGTRDPSGVFYEEYGAAVAWSLTTVEKTIEVDGITYTGYKHEKKSDPYIILINIRDSKTQAWLDDDLPLRGGGNAFMAREIGKSLIGAADYLDQLNQGE